MGRKVKEPSIDSKTARAKLKPRWKPYYRGITKGLHLGYRKGDDARRWVVRIYQGEGAYKVESLDGVVDDIKDADGKTVLNYTQAQKRALDLHSKHVATTDDGIHVGPYTVKQAIADYIDHLDGRASQNDTRLRLAAYVPDKLLIKECDKISRDELVAWHRHLAKAMPRSRTKAGAAKHNHRTVNLDDPEIARQRKVSANRILGQLKAALNHAVHVGKLASDRAPWRNVSPFKGVNAARVHYLKIAEAKRLINATDVEFRPMVHAALLTGCRYAELARLRVEDFNGDAGTVLIRHSKSGKSRHVVLTEEGGTFFERVTAGRGGSEIMLGTWKASQQIRRIKAACVRAKIDPPISFHGLRHTWASLAVMANVPVAVVARNLGHADTRMVEKHYGHLAPSYVADEIRRGAPRFGVDKSNIKRIA